MFIHLVTRHRKNLIAAVTFPKNICHPSKKKHPKNSPLNVSDPSKESNTKFSIRRFVGRRHDRPNAVGSPWKEILPVPPPNTPTATIVSRNDSDGSVPKEPAGMRRGTIGNITMENMNDTKPAAPSYKSM